MEERGWKSTRLHLACVAMALMTAYAARSGFPREMFDTFCMGILAAAGIYSGAHTFEKTRRPPLTPSKVDSPE